MNNQGFNCRLVVVLFIVANLHVAGFAWADATLEVPEYDHTGTLSNKTLLVFGDAYNPDKTKLLFREEHVITQTTHHMLYKNPGGNVIVEKNISYELSYLSPAYNLFDSRFSRKTGSEFRDNAWYVYREQVSGKRDELKLDSEGNLVIDAGFNNFVRLNFDTLVTGEALKFRFGIPDPLTELPMKLQSLSCSTHHLNHNDEDFLCMRARTTSFLYRWFVPDIYVIYSRDKHYLVEYDGPSSIVSDDDKGQNVHIEYRYETVAE